jgi:carbonic anhydrase
MIEIIWRHDRQSGIEEEQPQTAEEARVRLEVGSAAFAALSMEEGGQHIIALAPDALGLPSAPGTKIAQEPFAAVLGCSDARVPVELVFGQAANDLFIVRVAGNVPGTECLGSLDYAVSHLASLRLIAILGHTGCGAVTAAVDAFLAPESYFEIAGNPDLRAIVDAIMAAVTTSADAIAGIYGSEAAQQPGYRAALIETAVVINAAFTASAIQRGIHSAGHDQLGVVFGVYDLSHRSVGLPAADGWQVGLADPPANAVALGDLARRTAAAIKF